MNFSRVRPFTRVNAFVDWNSQLRLTNIRIVEEPVQAAKAALKDLARRITKCLYEIDVGKKYSVSLRLYHGWRKGYEPSPNFKAVQQTIAETDFSALSCRLTVTYSSNVEFGDCLLLAMPERMHKGCGIHLPNTLRKGRNDQLEEKMVDTAIAADAIVSAYRDPQDWLIIVGEDDDLIPPLFTAEAITRSNGARALFLSKRRMGNNFLLLEGLSV